jgi:hypothetical protein
MNPICQAIYQLYGRTQRNGEAAFMAGIHGRLMFIYGKDYQQVSKG